MDPIFHRVSIRKFQDKPVSREDILTILRAGMQSPSAVNQQPWEFYVVTDKALMDKLAHVSPYAKPCAGASVVIVPVCRKKGLRAPEIAQIDMAACQENLWLETDALGLGGVWMGIAPFRDRMDAVARILDLPDDLEAFSLFALGYPAEERPQQDRFEESRIHFM
jgi:nitroreductase